MSNLSSLVGMSKSTKSSKWWVRVDGEEVQLRNAIKAMIADDVLYCYGVIHKGENGDNSHIHFAIQVKDETQKQSFALRIKKHFNWIAKRSDYCCDVWDGNRGRGVISYCFHESDAVEVIRINFSDEEIEEAKRENQKVQKLVEKAKGKSNTRLPELAVAYFSDKEWNKYVILEWMLQRCKDGLSYYPNMFQLKKYVEEVEIRLTKQEDFPRLVNKFYQQLFPIG